MLVQVFVDQQHIQGCGLFHEVHAGLDLDRIEAKDIVPGTRPSRRKTWSSYAAFTG